MKPTRHSPIDVVGITLGVIAALLVAGGVVYFAQNRARGGSWPVKGMWSWGEDDAGSIGGWSREESDQQVEGSFTEVEIRSVAGSIDVIGGGTGAVGVHSVKTGPTAAARAGVRVDIQKLGNRLVIEEKRDGPPSGWRGSISFTVTVPRGVTAVRARSVSGSVTVRGAGTGVDQWLSTVSGAVSTDGARNLEASSTSGSLGFAFAGQVLDVHTVSGSIRGSIDAIADGGSVKVRTVSGPVVLEAFAGLDARLDLRSVSGPISCDFPVTLAEQRRGRLSGTIGGGSVPLEASTTSGPITIRKK